MLVKQNTKVAKIEGNDLHHIEENLQQMAETLQRIEVSLTYIKARLNGRSGE